MDEYLRVLVEWTHPVHGRRAEVLCPEHEREVLLALKVLRIGCIGRPVSDLMHCGRCERSAVAT